MKQREKDGGRDKEVKEIRRRKQARGSQAHRKTESQSKSNTHKGSI